MIIAPNVFYELPGYSTIEVILARHPYNIDSVLLVEGSDLTIHNNPPF